MPVNFPYDYGDGLTVEKAKQNLKDHGKDVLSAAVGLVFAAGVAHAADGPSPNDGLKKSMKQKAMDKPVVMSLPKPTSKAARLVNTGLFCSSILIVCQNAMWTGNPVLIAGCAAITVGFMFPQMLRKLF